MNKCHNHSHELQVKHMEDFRQSAMSGLISVFHPHHANNSVYIY